jgi:hypothetical protein
MLGLGMDPEAEAHAPTDKAEETRAAAIRARAVREP